MKTAKPQIISLAAEIRMVCYGGILVCLQYWFRALGRTCRSSASGDLVAGQFELLASLILIVLGWVFVPFYLESGVFTMPEFLEKRYNGWARSYLSYVSIVAYTH